jgi:acetolactate synthase-1/3 small subunit
MAPGGSRSGAHQPEARHHIVSVLVENKAGVLARVASLFSRRGYNIYSLAVAPTDDEKLLAHHHRRRRRVLPPGADPAPAGQAHQRRRHLRAGPRGRHRTRDAAGHRGRPTPAERGQVIGLVGIFEGKIVDVGQDRITVMLAGAPSKIDDFENLIRPYGIVELQRTGRVALPKLERRAARLHSVAGGSSDPASTPVS